MIKQQRVFDPITGIGVDLESFLIRQDHLFGILRDQAENPLFVIGDVLNERQLEGKARLLNGPLRLAKLKHQRLLGLVDGEQRTGRRNDEKDDNDDRHKTCGTHVSFLPTTCSAREVADTAQHRCHRQARQ